MKLCPTLVALLIATGITQAKPINYNQDVRPILSDKCYACHGPDEHARKADLRLDTKAGAFGEGQSGALTIVPGKLDDSELVARITMDESNRRHMPPIAHGKPLKPEEVAILKQWVSEGAPWQGHWAFEVPQRPEVPAIVGAKPIDAFIEQRLQDEGLTPNPPADKVSLIRRVTFDLIGLPPTPEEIHNFVNDGSPNAYETVVDRLLKSPQYGEHQARYWLDAARYGDTHGLHLDNYREMFPYRDWVIQAFNRNQPFDQFVIEQIAGDLLDKPTLQQLVATGFNRCHVTTSEGGSIVEEVYVRNVIERVDATGTVFLGLSVGCARCHDHKYDPITQKDYYSLFAYFNSLDGEAKDGNIAAPPPFIHVGSDVQLARLKQIKKELAKLDETIQEKVDEVNYNPETELKLTEERQPREYVWIDDELPSGKTQGPWTFQSDGPVQSGTKSVLLKTKGFKQFVLQPIDAPLNVGKGDKLFAWVWLDPKNPPKEIMLQWHSGEWQHRAYWGENKVEFGQDGTTGRHRVGDLPKLGEWVKLEVPIHKVGIKPGSKLQGTAFTQYDGKVFWDRAGIMTATPQAGQTFDTFAGWLKAQGNGKHLSNELQKLIETKHPDKNQTRELVNYFVAAAYSQTRPMFKTIMDKQQKLQDEHKKLTEGLPTTLIFKELDKPTPAFVLNRGEYDQKGEPVSRRVPGFLPKLPKDASNDRLGFANWLVASDNPLTARVAVNRMWQTIFGTGIVATSDDFGLQGTPPSHPELLDYLAVEYRESGWDTKAMLKRMVLSQAYQRSARLSPELLEHDPKNLLLARGPRYRLDAEMIRDQALFLGDLLVEKIGGPSVKPPQPAGLWEAVGYGGSNTVKFIADQGHEKVHRRSLYTFWKRTAPPPQMVIVDAPSRESCIIRRERTNTPLQALLFMNEPQFVESARAFAQRAMLANGDVDPRLNWMFEQATGRLPSSEEMDVLKRFHDAQLQVYENDVAAARKLIEVGTTKPSTKLNVSELAATTMVGNLILNMDTVLNK